MGHLIPEASLITPNLYQGSKPPQGSHVALAGFHVLVLTAMEYQPPKRMFPSVSVLYAPLDDAELTPREWTLAKRAALQVARALRDGKKVLVTCQQGRNRSGLVTAMALHMLTGKSGVSIVKHIQARRADALTNDSFTRAIATLPTRR